MKTLLVDMSPVFYSNLFSATSFMIRNGSTPVQIDEYSCPKLPFEYQDVIIFKIIEEISTLKHKFKVDEVVLAFDNSKGGYWRKDYWSGYKFSRKKSRDDSNIMWDKAFKLFDTIKEQLKLNTTYKTVDIQRVEGDDIIFVLSEHLSNKGNDVVILSLDHDLQYCLRHPGVQYFRTQKTQKKAGYYVDITLEDIDELEQEHIIGGDKGDYIKNIKAYSKFSKEFKEIYPNKKEIDTWDKRHEIDVLFEKKYNQSAYTHPRYGYKMFKKSKMKLSELLSQNPIYTKNYHINKKIALPEGIPEDIKYNIIEQYNSSCTRRNNKELQTFFNDYKLFDLCSSIPLL